MSTPPNKRVLRNYVYTWAVHEVKSTLEPLKEEDMSTPNSKVEDQIYDTIQDEIDAIWGISSEECVEPESPGIIVVGRETHIPPGILGHAHMARTSCKPIETSAELDNLFRNVEREAIQRKKLEESLAASMVIMSKKYDVAKYKKQKPKYRNRKKPWRRTF